MTRCASCWDIGLVPFVPLSNPKADSEIGRDDLHFAVCLCEAGKAMRWNRNNRAKTVPLWRLWAARERVHPSRICLAEQVFSRDELTAAGFLLPVVTDRATALLKAGKQT